MFSLSIAFVFTQVITLRVYYIFQSQVINMAAIFRESSAGQICRLFLGLKITPYIDEQDGFLLPQQAVGENAVATNNPESQSNRDPEKEGSEIGSDRSSDKDIEKEASTEPQQPSEKPEQKSDTYVVDWYGPDDKENPQNWSTAKKAFTFGQICLLTFSSKSLFYPSTCNSLTMFENSLQRLSHYYSS